MSESELNASGVLVLERVTPIIRTLYGDYTFDETYPGNGEVLIKRIEDTADPTWDVLLEHLISFSLKSNIDLPEATSDDDARYLDDVMHTLAEHFGVLDDADLRHLIKHYDYSERVSPAELFLIAACFNDGHNLTELKIESAWHTREKCRYQFGGSGLFLSRHVSMCFSSVDAVELGERIHRELAAQNLDEAAKHLADSMQALSMIVNDDATRIRLCVRVAEILLSQPPVSKRERA